MKIPDIGYAYIDDSETGEQILVNTSSKIFQKQYSKIMNQKIIENQTNMKKIGVDIINLSNEESFDITINRYFRNKWRMKN
jgi:hypothetical protein